MMKRIFVLLALCLCMTFVGNAQEVLREDMTFNRQSQIDSFPIMYPDCHRIDGKLTINGDKITNLMGFMKLDTLNRLEIANCPSLIKLKGLNNLKVLTYSFYLYENENLQSLDALSNLKKTNSIYMDDLPRLGSLEGLNNLDSLESLNLNYYSKPFGFKNLKGLEGLDYIENLSFYKIKDTFSTEGLDNVRYIKNIIVDSCNADFSFGGLPRIDSIRYISLFDNPGMEKLFISDSLKCVNSISIQNNSSLREISGLEGLHSAFIISFSDNSNLTDIPLFSSLDSAYVFGLYSNKLRDSIIDLLPNIKTLAGFTLHNCADIKYFSGLPKVTDLEYGLSIWKNHQLKHFNGLNNIETIEMATMLKANYDLEEISFLSSLRQTDALIITDCRSLSDLSPLNELNHVGTNLEIELNLHLETLPQWENLDMSNLTTLTIKDNPNLSYCHYDWLCNYLDNNRDVNISGNSGDCETLDMVKDACDITSTNELAISDISINISGKNIHVVSGKEQELKEIRLIAISGKEVFSKNCSGNFESISYRSYPAGLYVICVETDNKSFHKKLVLH